MQSPQSAEFEARPNAPASLPGRAPRDREPGNRAHRRVRPALVLASLCVLAAPAGAENLMDVLTLAEARDPEFRSVEAAYRAVRELRPQARAQLLLPQVGLSANTTYNEQDIDSEIAFGGTSSASVEFNTRGWQVSLTQPVYHYERWIALKQADSRINEAQLTVAAARQELILRAAERYFDTLAAIDSLRFAEAERTALARQLEQTRQRFEVGLIAITDVQEAQAGHDLAVAEAIRAQNQLDNALEALRELTGEFHHELEPLGTALPLAPPDPDDIERWTTRALGQNLRLQEALAATETAEREIDRQAAGHLPTLDIVGSHGFNKQGGRFGGTDIDATAIGFELNVPIYAGGQVLSLTREARHRHDEALERLEQQRRATERETRNAYLGVISGISRVQALRQAVVSSETAVAATTAGFEVGTRTSVDVVTAERELFRAKRDYARARYDYILDSLRLKRAAGTLAPEDIAEVNSWLGGS